MTSKEQEDRLKIWRQEAGDFIKNTVSKQKRKHRSSGDPDQKPKSKTHKYHEKLVEAAEEGREQFENWWLTDTSYIEPEDDEKTYNFTQKEILENVPIGAAQKTFDLKLPSLGPYQIDYSSNGRHLLLGGRKGHLAEVDWQRGKLLTEIQVRETVRDVQFLHNYLYWAAAQKKYVFIYDHDGMELHRLKSLHEPYSLEFLPHHFLLCSTGNTGFVSWQDTSSGKLVASYPSNKGCCKVMRQNPWNAVIGLGHSFGSITMWTPNSNSPVAQIKSHRTPISALAFDPTGNYMVSAGVERIIKVWDIRKFEELHCYFTSKAVESVDISQKGLLTVGYGTRVEIWKEALIGKQQKPYLAHHCQSQKIHCVRFCPYEDILGIGHEGGISQILVPGSGEPNFDSYVAHPFQNRKARRESEVAQLLDKLPPDMITLDPQDITKVKIAKKVEPTQDAVSDQKKENKKQRPRKEIPEHVPYTLRRFYPGLKKSKAQPNPTKSPEEETGGT